MNTSRANSLGLLIGIGIAALLSGCATPPDLGAKPELRAPASIVAERSLASAEPAQWPGHGWWQVYGDRQLGQLIEEGLAGSPDVAAALARIRRAQGLERIAGGALGPSFGASAAGGARKQSYNMGIPSEFVPKGWRSEGRASLDFEFDPDLWGRNRAALAAATSDTKAARIDADQAQLMLTTAIANAYAELARLYAEREVQAAAIDVRLSTQKLVTNRVSNGLDTRAELKQADAAVPQARADLAAIDEAIAMTRNQLAALVGAGPDRGLAVSRPSLSDLRPHGLPAGVSTDLVGRRPDIAAARARAEAAASRIKAARAAFYPAINLSAMIGFQSVGIGNLSDSGSFAGSAGPAISLPLFHSGTLEGRFREARGTYDAAVADYDRTVVNAYREVANAVMSRRSLGDQLSQSRYALTALEEAYSIALKRYQGGLSAYLDVLTAEERLLQARRSFAALSARAFALDVALVRALGGGFTQDSSDTPKEDRNG